MCASSYKPPPPPKPVTLPPAPKIADIVAPQMTQAVAASPTMVPGTRLRGRMSLTIPRNPGA